MKVLNRRLVTWAILTIPTLAYSLHGRRSGTSASHWLALGGFHSPSGVMRFFILCIVWLPLGSVGYGVWRLTLARKALNPPATPEKPVSIGGSS